MRDTLALSRIVQGKNPREYFDPLEMAELEDGIRAYGVSPGVSTRAEGKAAHLAHGPDERRSVPWLAVGTDLFRDIVRALVL